MKSIKVALLAGLMGLVGVVEANTDTSWNGTSAPNGVTIYNGGISELWTKIASKTHYLKSEMTGSAFDGGIAQCSDFWKSNDDGTYTVQIQCVYKNDLRFVNLQVFEESGVVKAKQIDQNWCSGTAAALAFEKFVEDNRVSHNVNWKPGPAHYYASSLAIAPISDCEAAIGDVNYKTLNEAKKVAMAAPAGSDQKFVTLKRDKILWTSTYIQNFTLIIPQGVKFTLANDDTADYNDENAKIYVKGTLDVRENCHLTVGKNVLELYAGGQITGIGDNYGLFFVTNTKEIPVRAVEGQETFLIGGDILSNCNITFNVDSGVSLSVTGGINPSTTGYTVNNTGSGQMAVKGNVGGMYTVTPEKTLDVGGITYNTDYLVVSYGGTITNTNTTEDRNGSKCQMNNLVLSADTKLTGYSFGVVKKGYAGTVVDLGGKTLTLDLIGGGNWTTRNFYLANTTIKNGGEFVIKKGDLVLVTGTDSTMNSGVMRLQRDGVLNPNGRIFTIANLRNEGGTISLSGGLVITEALSGANTISTLTMNDDTTIKLSGAEQLKVTSSLTVNGRLTVDLTDYQSIDQAVMELPTAAAAQAVVENAAIISPTIRPGTRLVAQGTKVYMDSKPMTLYWAAWRGTFWEHIGQTDANGNHGLMRDESGNLNIAHRPNDTVVFDKTHYTVGGEYLTTQYWHYDENLYIKNEVIPGDTNDWDLKVLGGVTLKMGLRGARTTGQNVISKLKIYVEAGSMLELGYWGNTHHYQGVIRDDVTFGGAGTIKLGDDMGASCRVEGDLKTKGADTPTLDVRDKELVVQGGQIDINLTGFGALSGSGTITMPITFNNATIDATDAKGFTFKNETTFTGNLTVDLTSAPTGKDLVKICTKGEGGSFVFTEGIDVIVRVGGEVQPAFYTLDTDNDGNLCVKVAPVTITYDADVVLGYDYKTMICRVWMSPAIEGVIAKVTVKNVGDNLKTWTAPVIGMRGSGRCEVLVGDADNYFEPGTYSMTVLIGGTTLDPIEYNLEVLNDGKLAKVGEVGYDSMENAVAAAKSSGGTITLLTNVFFAAPEGTYSIERNGFDVKTTNYTTIDAFTNEVTAENEVIFERGGEGITRVVIAGDWIAAGLPWRTKKAINTDIWVKAETMEMAPFEAYVLGIPAETWTTETIIARGVETGDPETIKIDDGLTLKDASDTGVVVTRKLIDADTRATVSETNVLELKNVNKVKLLKLAYDFAADGGQE